ncbi:zinc finger, C2H2 type, partial [Ostertagia ostertagi]
SVVFNLIFDVSSIEFGAAHAFRIVLSFDAGALNVIFLQYVNAVVHASHREMSSECFLCGQEVNRLYDHLFGRHDYTKEQLEKLKRTKAEMRKRGNADENSNIYSCENCEKDYSKRDSFLKHQRRCIQQGTNEPERGSVECPECGHISYQQAPQFVPWTAPCKRFDFFGKRVKENNASDGLLFYAPSQDDTSDGFCLVIINELQRKWLAEFSRKGIGNNDAFNVTMYKLRLVPIIVADHCDRGLPTAFLLSFRTHRIDEWSAQHRKGAVMNTSMMCERWHKHLKREVFRSKSKIRIDELVDSLIEVVKEMEEDSVVIERRGLIEGRYRLKNHLLSHSKAVSYYHESRDLIDVVQPGVWKIRAKKSDKLYMVEQERCPCEKVTNHCNKPGCSVCPYSFFCECNDDRRAGISCMQYSRSCLEYAGLHLKLRRIAAKPTREAEQCLNDALAAMKRSHTTLKSKLSTLAPPTRNEPIIATRPELPSCGPVPADAQPIRLKTTSSINKAKRKPSLAVPKEFASEDVRVCGFCFQENPFNDDCDIVYWLKCSSCNTWGHMGNCTVVSAKCTVCTKGTMEFSEQ